MMSVEELAHRAGFVGKNLDNTIFGTPFSLAISNLIALVRDEAGCFVEQEKEIWAVYNNTDLTEGRGRQFREYTCESKFTAIRLASRAGVQGSDAEVRPVKAFKIGSKWYAPREQLSVIAPSADDVAKENQEHQKEQVLQKARALGLTEEEIKTLKSV